MKKIEFRGLYHGRFWIHGDYMENEGKHFIRNKVRFDASSVTIESMNNARSQKKISDPPVAFVEVMPQSIGINIGRVDKNKKPIFTGDTVRYNGMECEVYFDDDDSMFKLIYVEFGQVIDAFEMPRNQEMELTGTIYDNIILEANKAAKS